MVRDDWETVWTLDETTLQIGYRGISRPNWWATGLCFA
jgi:hypothetical protein